MRAYRRPVILSFGHEMNGYWYTWGNTHTSPADFVDAWRHIVTLFRAEGAENVTWLWTINAIQNEAQAQANAQPDRCSSATPLVAGQQFRHLGGD